MDVDNHQDNGENNEENNEENLSLNIDDIVQDENQENGHEENENGGGKQEKVAEENGENNINKNKSKEEKPKKQENEEEEEKELEYNEVDEDNYMQELYTQLAKMRQERKDAQNNAKLLDNRVNLLRNEERKELKKIENAKQKANNKLIRLQQMVETNKIREESKKLKEKEIEIKKNHNKKMNEEIKTKTEKSKAMHKKQIEDGAKLVKMQKQYNKQLYDFLKKENFNENKTKYNCLKNQKSYNEEQKKLISREKRMFLKQELEKKLLEEYRLKEEAEAKKCKAEQEEIEIIKKLQTTTQLHKNIMNEIEKMNINTVIKGGTHPKNSNNTSKSGSSKHNK